MAVDVADALSRVSIFSHLKKKDLQSITKKSRYCSYKPGEIVIELLQTLYRRYRALERILVEATGGFIPVCAGCKKISNDRGAWVTIEQYLMDYTEYELSHVICPDCRQSLWPETNPS